MQVLNTEHIPTTCPAGTAGASVDTALRLWTSVDVGICHQVHYSELVMKPPMEPLLFLFFTKKSIFVILLFHHEKKKKKKA